MSFLVFFPFWFVPLLTVFLSSKCSYLSYTPISWSFHVFFSPPIIQFPPFLQSPLPRFCHGHFPFWALLCTPLCFLIFHSSALAWRIPRTEEPGGLQSMGSLRVGHDWATSLSLFTFMHWRRKWQPTPVLLPGESQGQRSLVGWRLWGHTESDMTEAT